MNDFSLDFEGALFDCISDLKKKERLVTELSFRITESDAEFLRSDRFAEMLDQCRAGTFSFSAPYRIHVPKKTKGCRPAYILPREEQLLQKYVLYALTHYMIRDSSAKSVLLVQGKATPLSISKIVGGIYERYDVGFCVKTDVKSISESLDRSILIEKLRDYFDDDLSAFLFFEKLVISEECIENGIVQKDAPAVKAGMPLIEFLYYIYFRSADGDLFRNNIPFLRFHDSYYLFAETRAQAQDMLLKAKQYAASLHLNLNEEKTEIISKEEPFRIMFLLVKNGECRLDYSYACPLLRRLTKAVNQKVIAAKEKGVPLYVVMWSTVRLINTALYGDDGAARYLFQMAPDTETLRKIDRALQDIVRFAGSGKRSPARYRISYNDMKSIGYRSLVNEYYRWRNR